MVERNNVVALFHINDRFFVSFTFVELYDFSQCRKQTESRNPVIYSVTRNIV